MKKSVILVIACLSLVGCSQQLQSEADQDGRLILTDEMVRSKKVYIQLNGPEEIKMFDRAVEDSVKVMGIVNVSDPMYTFKNGEDSYFLWITQESGAIMNQDDNQTLYELSDDSVAQVYRFLTEK